MKNTILLRAAADDLRKELNKAKIPSTTSPKLIAIRSITCKQIQMTSDSLKRKYDYHLNRSTFICLIHCINQFIVKIREFLYHRRCSIVSICKFFSLMKKHFMNERHKIHEHLIPQHSIQFPVSRQNAQQHKAIQICGRDAPQIRSQITK